MPRDNDVPGVKPYDGPAGGWGALGAVARAIKDQMAIAEDTRALMRMNQPSGFDCPGCAWPDPKHTSSFEFCENGAKAVSWETTSKRAGPEFFAEHPVAELWGWTDHALEDQGRLTHPMAYDRATDRYLPVSWDEAFRRIGERLRGYADPNMVEFYTSGRASNEAAFLYQLFVREYGTNNFPDCSNMCHEATSVGLPESIGVGKGTVTLKDFDLCDAIFCIGHNPGTNHPRMLTTLREASKRGVPIVVFNPLRERGLERFAAPQNPMEMLTLGSTPIASAYHQVKVGGDVAVLKGMMKALLAADAADLAAGGPGLLDRGFITEQTTGFEALAADLETVPWDVIEAQSGLPRSDIEAAARIYAEAKNVIVCYGMGLTQHRTAPRTCSSWPTCCCCAATSAGRAPGSARCAAIPTCRATAPSASPRSRPSRSSTRPNGSSASPRRGRRATTRWRRCRRSSTAGPRRSSASAATLPSPCRTRRRCSPACAGWTWRCTSPPS